ncbi:hypothetical protein LPB140_04805 [Sphingorhabdus lutea]|uniref:DUF2891 domain-containing protein n=1 Tax=Sphingorhabdus lutea TaxID=1913578 RepID=A0A1L3JAT2_9SPHN|nr:hypothetical protein LPB140_04805 [Sphingorhabdus lutea]
MALCLATLSACNDTENKGGLIVDNKVEKGQMKPATSLPKDAAETGKENFARLAIDCVSKQYPNKISHVLNSQQDVKSPQQLHPSFYGCFDWHSAVHGHWMLVRLWGRDEVPNLDAEIEAILDRNLTDGNIAGERQYFMEADRDSFERPYGMAWLMQLSAELREISQGQGPKADKAKIYAKRLAPLEAIIGEKLKAWLPKLAYPIREGTHAQSAFAFGLIHDWSKIAKDEGMAKMIADTSMKFYAKDEACPLAYEPSGEDFLSPCLMEADLMRRIMPQDKFVAWFDKFLPNIPDADNDDWLPMGVVNDRSDGKLVHLDGLNLSRAWALEGIISALPADHPKRATLSAALTRHADTALQNVSGQFYSGGHWLASFATYLTTQRGINGPAQAANKTENAPKKEMEKSQ